MAKILSSLFIPIYLSWVVNQTLENLYWFLTLIAKRAVFWIFFYLSMPESFFCGRLHPSRGMFDDYYLCSLSCNTLPKKKKKKSRRGLVRETPYIVPNWLKKKLYAIEYKQYSFFRGSNWNWKPSTILLSWLPFARCLMHLVWTWRFINSG